MLSALGTTDDKLDGFDAGADDYMVKPFDFRELTARIRALLKRQMETNLPPRESIVYADLQIDLIRKEVRRGNIPLHLSPKEYKLLVYLVENAGRVIARTEIAEKVWETHFDTGTNFIDVYINYLRKKVDRDFDVKLIHTRPGMGFILTDAMPGAGRLAAGSGLTTCSTYVFHCPHAGHLPTHLGDSCPQLEQT